MFVAAAFVLFYVSNIVLGNLYNHLLDMFGCLYKKSMSDCLSSKMGAVGAKSKGFESKKGFL